VGSGTAGTARAAGIPVALVPEQFTAEGLAAAWPAATLPGARVLWPRASGARPTLARLLRAAGAEVTAPDAYDTRADGGAGRRLHEELRSSPADALLFTSPSAVRAFASAGVAPGRLIIGVIGSITAAAAREAGLSVEVQPARPTLVELAAALAAYFASTNPSTGQPAEPAPGKA
jgi:uroporphyrinogen-III synthase